MVVCSIRSQTIQLHPLEHNFVARLIESRLRRASTWDKGFGMLLKVTDRRFYKDMCRHNARDYAYGLATKR